MRGKMAKYIFEGIQLVEDKEEEKEENGLKKVKEEKEEEFREPLIKDKDEL